VSDEARKLSLGAMTNLMCRGRKRGLAGVIATQRLAKLAKNVAAEASNFLMGRTFLDIDMARAADLLGMERRQAEAFRDLERGQFMALGPGPVPSSAGPAHRPDRNKSAQCTPRLMPLPEATLEDARAIILAAPPPEPVRPQRRAPSSPDLLGQLMAAKSAALEIRPDVAETPISAEELAERRSASTACCAPSWRSPTQASGWSACSIRNSWSAAASRASVPPCRTSTTSAAC
jgi:hypothetical protein